MQNRAQYLKNLTERMDPISTGVGLAASLVTLIGLAANSCKTLHELQQKLRSAPEDIQRLVLKVETFKAFLAVTERESRSHGSDKVPLELQQIWAQCENTMRKDLQAFAGLAKKLNDTLDGPTITGKTIRARARKILSEQAVRKCEDAFDQYKGVLDSVQGMLNGYSHTGVYYWNGTC